ncbi:sulfite exporter TauE/SafE family protein [soil metagenome]
MGAWTHDLLGLLYGLIVGVSLGLTGGGGSIFAVPLLIYGLGVPVGSAIGLSLAAVGVTAGFGAALRLKAREVDLRAGLVFAGAGMVLAPAGAFLGAHVPAPLLRSTVALLMGCVGLRMWRGKAGDTVAPGPCAARPGRGPGMGCYVRLAAAGCAAGILAGLFGIGGGFVIVPALLYVTGMSIHRAVATSLLVIFLIALSGVAAHLAHGQQFPMPVTALFIGGGFAGMFAGGALRSRLSGPALQRLFAVAMWVVAAFLLARNLPALFQSMKAHVPLLATLLIASTLSAIHANLL